MHNSVHSTLLYIEIMHKRLTPRQQKVFDYIREAIEATGFPPTRAEIATRLGFKSTNAAEEHLQALARKRVIHLLPGTSRGIRIHESILLDEQKNQAANNPISLPLIGRVAAGSPILAQEHIEKEIRIDPHFFTIQPDYLLKVRGMSMRDAGILEGDLLAVKKTQYAYNDQIVVARLGDDVTVKRYRKTGEAIELVPEHPDYHVIQVTDPHFTLEGVVVGLLRHW